MLFLFFLVNSLPSNDLTVYLELIYPLVTNGLLHRYQLDESITSFRGDRGNFSFLFHFSMKIVSANRIAPDGDAVKRGVTSGAILFASVP